MSSPFEDPDVQKFMAHNGIVHQPGTAAGKLEELAPLLAAEGVDLDAIESKEQLQSALDRASEQHNLMLFTPVEAHRTQTLGLLRRLAEAAADGQDTRVEQLLDAVQPDETPETPAASHVIGVSTGLLDTWYADRSLQRSLDRTRIPDTDRVTYEAATDLLALARKHRAFDSISQLILGYGGKVLMDAGALATAAAITAIAGSGESVTDVARRLLLDDRSLEGVKDFSKEKPDTGSAFFRTDPETEDEFPLPEDLALSPQQQALVQRFRSWLEVQEQIAAPSVDDEISLFEVMLAGAHPGTDVDLQDPDDLSDFIEELGQLGESDDPEAPGVLQNLLSSIHDYVDFQEETSKHPLAWADVHDQVEDAEREAYGSPSIDDLVAALPQVSDEERHEAIAATRVISAVGPLLAWIGERRKVTQKGGLRRADISEFAALLGINAAGVTRTSYEPLGDVDLTRPASEPELLQLTSIWDSPVLGAWWTTLQEFEIIGTNTSSARPGPQARQWADGTVPRTDEPGILLGSFLGSVLTYDIGSSEIDSPVHRAIAAETSARLLASISPELFEQTQPTGTDLLGARVLGLLADLERLGILTLDEENNPVIPDALQSSVVFGVLEAMAVVGT